MKPVEPTDRERAAAGNGDMTKWIEYEADVNRPADWMGTGDPDPKYDLANNHASIEDVFCNQFERMWHDNEKDRIPTGDTPTTQGGTDSTP